LEFSINAKQSIAIIWTIIAIIISLIVTLAIGWPVSSEAALIFPAAWEWLVVLFFGLFLVLAVPVYLLIALWHIVSKSDTT